MAASHALVLGSSLIRRFCACGSANVCGCGLDRPASGWTIAGLAELKGLMTFHGSLATVAELTGRTRHECNVALDALVGRTPAHALAVLEARTARLLRTPRQFSAAFPATHAPTAQRTH